MIWNPVWPFKSRESVLAYERVYFEEWFRAPDGRRINIGSQEDIQRERWLEREMPKQRTSKTINHECIRNVYIWKMRSTTGNCEIPSHLNTPEFAEALLRFCAASSENEIIESIKSIISFSGVKIRVASAFMYWLRPNEFQLIDRRVTAALNLLFNEEDYNVENYLRYCEYCKLISIQQNLSLRQIDRALFIYHKLMEKGVVHGHRISDTLHYDII